MTKTIKITLGLVVATFLTTSMFASFPLQNAANKSQLNSTESSEKSSKLEIKKAESLKKITANTETKDGASNKLVATILWLFLGWFGAHSFYQGKKNKGILQLILGLIVVPILGFVLLFVGAIGIYVFLLYALWLLIDLIMILIK